MLENVLFYAYYWACLVVLEERLCWCFTALARKAGLPVSSNVIGEDLGGVEPSLLFASRSPSGVCLPEHGVLTRAVALRVGLRGDEDSMGDPNCWAGRMAAAPRLREVVVTLTVTRQKK